MATSTPIAFSPASPAKRLASYLFDRSALYIGLFLLSLLAIVLFLALGKNPGWVNWFMQTREGFFVPIVLWMVYCISLEGSRSATWGKTFMGCHVVDRHGSRISYGRAAARFFASLINVLTFGLGFVSILIRKDRRGLHDLLAGTWVVHDNPAKPGLRWLGKCLIALYATIFVAAVGVWVYTAAHLRA